MKKFLLVLLVFIFLPCLNVYGDPIGLQGSNPVTPMFVVDSTLNALMAESGAEQVIHYAQMVKDNITQIAQTKEMIENAVQQTKYAVQNWKSIADIESWGDFMDWYNRQLYLERQAIEKAKGITVKIGKAPPHSIYDLEGIANDFNQEYVDYWDKEFTEEQRREMWLALGLSPSNYAYVQPYRIKGREVARQLLTMSEIQNDKNMKDSQNNNKKKDALAADSSKPPEEQMGQKEVLQNLLDVAIQSDEKLSDIAAIEAKRAEAEGIDKNLNRPLPPSPQVSSWQTGGLGFGEKGRLKKSK